MPTPVRILTVVGARPQFIKAATLSRAIRRSEPGQAQEILVHTGQHFDSNMSDVFFDEMDIPRPSHHLGIAGGSHGDMTGRMLAAIEAVIQAEKPDWVLVYGDTNSTLAGTLAAVKLHVPVAHVEAGLRSFNRAMPEEINRVLTDHAADVLFAPTDAAVANLANEGLNGHRVVRTGDVMLDAVMHYRTTAQSESRILDTLELADRGYVLATVHRAENTDDPTRLAGIIEGLCRIGETIPVVLPVHPRTRAAIERNGLTERAAFGIRLIEPVGYFDMVRLEAGAALIATDSGGVRKEACFHGVPCVTLRDETEWVELIDAGVNVLAGADTDAIVSAATSMLGKPIDSAALYGDGNAAHAILQHIIER